MKIEDRIRAVGLFEELEDGTRMKRQVPMDVLRALAAEVLREDSDPHDHVVHVPLKLLVDVSWSADEFLRYEDLK